MHLGNEQKEERKEELRGEDEKGELKVVQQALQKFETTPSICLFHKLCVRKYKKTGGRVSYLAVRPHHGVVGVVWRGLCVR